MNPLCRPIARRLTAGAISLLVITAAIVQAPACASAAVEDDAPAAAEEAVKAPPTTPLEQTAAVTVSPEEQKAGGISVGPVGQDASTGELTTTALLQMNDTRTARVGALVEGVVEQTDAQVGDRIARGARLATVHSHLVHDMRADHRRALAEQRRAAAELGFAREAEARTQRLLAAKAASLHEVQRAQADREVAEEAVVVANSEARRAADELEHFGLEHLGVEPARGDTVPVVAPSGGVVMERLVTPGTAITPGVPLFVISDLSTLWAIAEIDETRLPELAVGRAASVTVSAYPDRTFAGTVVAIGDAINPETRRVTARIEIANPQGRLKPNMFATVRLAAGAPRDVMLVPVQAVQKVAQQPVVFVEASPGRFLARQVRTGSERDGHIEVLEGLMAADRIALSGAFLLKSRLVEAGSPE